MQNGSSKQAQTHTYTDTDTDTATHNKVVSPEHELEHITVKSVQFHPAQLIPQLSLLFSPYVIDVLNNDNINWKVVRPMLESGY